MSSGASANFRLTHRDAKSDNAKGDDSIGSKHGARAFLSHPRVDESGEAIEQQVFGRHLQDENLDCLFAVGVSVGV